MNADLISFTTNKDLGSRFKFQISIQHFTAYFTELTTSINTAVKSRNVINREMARARMVLQILWPMVKLLNSWISAQAMSTYPAISTTRAVVRNPAVPLNI